jgi:hypothetical protein
MTGGHTEVMISKGEIVTQICDRRQIFMFHLMLQLVVDDRRSAAKLIMIVGRINMQLPDHQNLNV